MPTSKALPHAPEPSMSQRFQPRLAAARQQRGFSLIEIIIVVVIIAAIAAFVASRTFGGSDRAKVNLARAQVQTVAEKVHQFEMDTGRLPASLQELVANPGAPGWLGPYAREGELLDPWNTPFHYQVPGQGQRFELVSYGADRAPGGESTAADIRYE